MKIKITVHEGKPPVEIGDTENVNAVISSSSKEARSKGMLNIIFIEVDNGNCIHFVVGGDETVLGFVYGHQNPPYYASKGNNENDHPVMTAFASFRHHTEFSRKSVISTQEGMLAMQEFCETGELPKCINWIEV